MQEQNQPATMDKFSPYLLIVLMTLIAWTPFGHDITPIGEMWFMQSQVESLQGIISSWSIQADRIFWFWSVLLGHWLTPETFQGQQIVFMGVYILRGTLTYLILHKLFPKLKAWALTVSVLSLFCPSDPDGFWLGALHVHAHDALFLLPVYMFLQIWEQPKVWKWILLFFFQNIVLWSYEGTLLLNMTVPMLSLYLENSWKPSKYALKNWLFWYISPMLSIFIRLVMFFNASRTHFVRKIDRSFDFIGILDGLAKAFYTLFIGWTEKISLVFQTDVFLAYTVGVFLLYAGYLLLNEFNFKEETNQDTKNIGARIFIGLALILLGFFPYALTDLLRYRYDRTLILPWLGATIVFTTGIWEISKKTNKKGYLAFLISSFFLASTISFSMHHRQVQISDTNYQNQALIKILSTIPKLQKNTAVLLICEDCPDTRAFYAFSVDAFFDGAIRFIYRDNTLRGFTYHYSNAEDKYYKPTGIQGRLDQFPLNRLIIIRYLAEKQEVKIEKKIPTEIISADNPTLHEYAPALRYESNSLLPYRACLLFRGFFTLPNTCAVAP